MDIRKVMELMIMGKEMGHGLNIIPMVRKS